LERCRASGDLPIPPTISCWLSEAGKADYLVTGDKSGLLEL
jgi:hypothetical protein